MGNEFLNKAPLIILRGLDSFEKEVIEERKPVLLLCISRADDDFQQQINVTESISKIYGEALKVFRLEEETIGAIKQKFNFKGTPTFLIFFEGREKDRLLGHAEEETLRDFLSRNLPLLQSRGTVP